MTTTTDVNKTNIQEAAQGATATPNMNIHQHLPWVEDGIRIIQIGAGGTGGPLVQAICRIIGNLAPKYTPFQSRLEYFVADDDVVEEKNLGRQLFVAPDVGRKKVEVLTARYGSAYNVPDTCMGYMDQRIDTPEDLRKHMANAYTNIIIDAVDNNKTRRNVILEGIKQFVTKRSIASVYLVSCGNGEWSGQVGMGCVLKNNNTIARAIPGRTVFDEPYYFSVPLPYVHMPELLDVSVDEREESMSCDERAVANAQSLVANQHAYLYAYTWVNSIVTQFIHQCDGLPDMPIDIGVKRFNAINNRSTDELLTDAYVCREVW